jgi:hypothetical protein
MVEKWMKGNNMKTNPPNFRVRVTPKGTRGSKAYYGKPVSLFKDSDKDGVPNVFDCQPSNKRRQDVISPMSGSNPLQEMHYRQEANRQQREYMKQLRELQRAEEARAKETGQPVQVVDARTFIDRTQWYANPYVVSSSGTWYPAASKTGKQIISAQVKPASTSTPTPTVSTGTYSNVKAVTSAPSGTKVYSSPLFSKAAPVVSTPAPKQSVVSRVVSWLKK